VALVLVHNCLHVRPQVEREHLLPLLLRVHACLLAIQFRHVSLLLGLESTFCLRINWFTLWRRWLRLGRHGLSEPLNRLLDCIASQLGFLGSFFCLGSSLGHALGFQRLLRLFIYHMSFGQISLDFHLRCLGSSLLFLFFPSC